MWIIHDVDGWATVTIDVDGVMIMAVYDSGVCIEIWISLDGLIIPCCRDVWGNA